MNQNLILLIFVILQFGGEKSVPPLYTHKEQYYFFHSTIHVGKNPL